MFIYWTLGQATIFPVVVLRKVNNFVQEDLFVFISDDLKPDVPFVEICNNIIHKYYADINMPVLTDIKMVEAVSSSALQLLLDMHVALYQLLESSLKQAMESQSQMDLVGL